METDSINNSSKQTNWYVITGGPSSGKTTTVTLLKERGYITTMEHARHYLDTQRLKGKTEIPPRNPKDKILTKDTMKGIVFSGTIMGLASFGAFLLTYFNNFHISNHYEKAITVTFISIIFSQYANLLSRRTYGPALGKYFLSNSKLLLAFLFSISCILLIVYVPTLNYYFHTSPLLATDWLYPIIAGSVCLAIFEFKKMYVLKKHL